MSFRPKNTPTVYMAMIHYSRKIITVLFAKSNDIILLDATAVINIYNNDIITDTILISSNYIPTLLHYFSCVAQVFIKHRSFFKVTKFDFSKPQVTFVGHDLTTSGNTPSTLSSN